MISSLLEPVRVLRSIDKRKKIDNLATTQLVDRATIGNQQSSGNLSEATVWWRSTLCCTHQAVFFLFLFVSLLFSRLFFASPSLPE